MLPPGLLWQAQTLSDHHSNIISIELVREKVSTFLEVKSQLANIWAAFCNGEDTGSSGGWSVRAWIPGHMLVGIHKQRL